MRFHDVEEVADGSALEVRHGLGHYRGDETFLRLEAVKHHQENCNGLPCRGAALDNPKALSELLYAA